MILTKMAVLRQNYLKLLAALVIIAALFEVMSVSHHHKEHLVLQHEIKNQKEDYQMQKGNVEVFRIFNKENARLFVDVLEKLSNFLNKTNPVVNIRLEMKTNEEEINKVTADRINISAAEIESVRVPKREESQDFDTKLQKTSLGRRLESEDYDAREVLSGDASNNITGKHKDAFFISLDYDKKQLLYETVNFFAVICAKLNITYMMYGGTLLGSWGHHDIIPWDDDIDLQVNIRNRDELYSALSLDTSQYRVISAGPRLKLFSRDGTKTSRYPWLWPYIDIHFYRENDTHIKDSSKEFAKYVYEKALLFPVHLRPFGPLKLSAPRDSYATLRKTYKGHKCETYSYSHRLEQLRKLPKNVVPCENFKDQVAFVHRTQSKNGGLKETLMLGDSVIQTLIVQEPEYAVTNPYSLELLP